MQEEQEGRVVKEECGDVRGGASILMLMSHCDSSSLDSEEEVLMTAAQMMAQ